MAPDFLQAEIESRFKQFSSSASGPARSAVVAMRRGLVNRCDIISQVEFGLLHVAGSDVADLAVRADCLCDSVTFATARASGHAAARNASAIATSS